MFAEFLGLSSKSTFHGNALAADELFLSDKILDGQTDNHKIAEIPVLKFIFRRFQNTKFLESFNNDPQTFPDKFSLWRGSRLDGWTSKY